MGLREDIAVIEGRTDISAEEKRRAIYSMKASALAQVLRPLRGLSFTVNGLSITLTRDPVYDPTQGHLSVWVSAVRGAVPIDFPPGALPLVYVNPPVMHDGVEDPLGAAKAMIETVVGRFG